MILELYIENFAIIEKTNISFTKGLNILTGETGSGKSIIVEALELILGSRADRDYIGKYTDRSIIEASILVDKKIIAMMDEKYGIRVNENIIVTREIYKSDKSINRIDGRRVQLNIIQDLMSETINLHGQNDNYLLNNEKNYLNILDSLDNKNIEPIKEKLQDLFASKALVETDLKKLDITEEELQRNIDLLTYQINEIDEAGLEKIDLEKLENEYKKLTNLSEITKRLSKVSEYFSSYDYGTNDISGMMANIISELNRVCEYDSYFTNINNELNNISYQLDDISTEISDYINRSELDEERINEIDKTLHHIEELKRKYGGSVGQIISYRDEIDKELRFYLSHDEKYNSLRKRLLELESEIIELSNSLSKIRKDLASKVEKDLLRELYSLNFPDAEFKLLVDRKDKADKTGIDKVDFLVSFNLGQDVKSLSKIGSGGEISRFMLALKILTAGYDEIKSLIFDEVDTGISGITADKVGNALKKISSQYQVILVTHLPQIAIQADNHILIEKYNESGISKTRLKELEDEDKVLEIARLIGGSNISQGTIDAARELIKSKE